MKKFALDFLHRGLVACGFGPIVLAIIYFILHKTAELDTLEVDRVCIGVLSIAALAFLAGGMNAVYQLERLPLMVAILLHGGALYAGYLATYLVNGWLAFGTAPIVVFSAIFVIGYIIIWAIIYLVTKRNTETVNKALLQKQRKA